MSETQFLKADTLVTDTIITGNISVNNDLLDQWLYLLPSASNAATIVAGMTRMANTYGRSIFGANIIATTSFAYANLYGTMGSGQIYGTTYLPGGYVFCADGNGPGQCSVFSSKNNTISNYGVAGTGGNGTHIGGTLPDGRAIIVPIGTGNLNYQIWDNITRTSTNSTIGGGITSAGGGSTLLPNGNFLLIANGANLCTLNTTTFAWSNTLNMGTNSFGAGCVVDVTGNVIIAPASTSGVGVYNPVTNTVTTVAPSGATPGTCWGAANAGDGRVVFGPFNQTTNLFIYNPFTYTCTTISYSWPGATGNTNFGGPKSMPDGQVLLIPWGGGVNYFAIFNPYTNSITTFQPTLPVGQTGLATNAFLGGSFVPDGRFILANTTGYSNVPILNFMYRSIPEAWCLNPLIQNHGR